MSNHLISGNFEGMVNYLAVCIFWNDPFKLTLQSASGQPMSGTMAIVVPEPAMVSAVMIAAPFLRRRRRSEQTS